MCGGDIEGFGVGSVGHGRGQQGSGVVRRDLQLSGHWHWSSLGRGVAEVVGGVWGRDLFVCFIPVTNSSRFKDNYLFFVFLQLHISKQKHPPTSGIPFPCDANI